MEEQLKCLYVQSAILNYLYVRQSQSNPSEFWSVGGVISPNDLRACLEQYTCKKAKKVLDKNTDETFLFKLLK